MPGRLRDVHLTQSENALNWGSTFDRQKGVSFQPALTDALVPRDDVLEEPSAAL